MLGTVDDSLEHEGVAGCRIFIGAFPLNRWGIVAAAKNLSNEVHGSIRAYPVAACLYKIAQSGGNFRNRAWCSGSKRSRDSRAGAGFVAVTGRRRTNSNARDDSANRLPRAVRERKQNS